MKCHSNVHALRNQTPIRQLQEHQMIKSCVVHRVESPGVMGGLYPAVVHTIHSCPALVRAQAEIKRRLVSALQSCTSCYAACFEDEI